MVANCTLSVASAAVRAFIYCLLKLRYLVQVFSRIADSAKFNMDGLDGTERSQIDAPSDANIN